MAISGNAIARSAAEATARSRRQTGVAILALCVASIGIAMLMWAGAWFEASDFAAGSPYSSAARLIALVLASVAVQELALAYGVWRLRPWAWPLSVAATIGALLLTILSAGLGSDGAHTASILLEIGTLWYLFSAGVRDAFGRNGSDSAGAELARRRSVQLARGGSPTAADVRSASGDEYSSVL